MSCLIIFTPSRPLLLRQRRERGPQRPSVPARPEHLALRRRLGSPTASVVGQQPLQPLAPAGGGSGQAIPILVTEGGWSLAANTSAEGAADLAQIYYYANYTSEVRKAIVEDKVNVIGYYAWSLMDNFGEPAPEYCFPRKCIAFNTACARS